MGAIFLQSRLRIFEEGLELPKLTYPNDEIRVFIASKDRKKSEQEFSKQNRRKDSRNFGSLIMLAVTAGLLVTWVATKALLFLVQ